MSVQNIKKALIEARTELNMLGRQLKDRENSLSNNNKLAKVQEAIQLIVQNTAIETQQQLTIHIKDLVQSAIDVCFPNSYEFIIEFDSSRSRTACTMAISKDNEIMNPMDNNGGGLIDVIAFALRVAALGLSSYDKVIFMDEPFKFISENLKPVAAELMASLSHSLGLQLIIVTHDEEITATADRIFSVKLNGKRSVVTVS